jgi:hypothetical protein
MGRLGYFCWLVGRTLDYVVWGRRVTIPLLLVFLLSGVWTARRVRPFPYKLLALQFASVVPLLAILVLGTWFECRDCDDASHHLATLAMHVLSGIQGLLAIILVLLAGRVRVLACLLQALVLWCTLWAWVAAREAGPFL